MNYYDIAWSEVYSIVLDVRKKYYNDILRFMEGDVPKHDCVEINGEVAERVRDELGLVAELVSVCAFMSDVGCDHFVAAVKIGDEEYVADAAPELSGAFDHVLDAPLLLPPNEYVEFYRENSYLFN